MLHLNVSDSLAHGLGCKCRIIIRVWKRWERYYIYEEVQMVLKEQNIISCIRTISVKNIDVLSYFFVLTACIVKHCWIHGFEVGFNWKCVVGSYVSKSCKKPSHKICSRTNQQHIFNVRMFLTRFARLQTNCMYIFSL